MRFCISLPSCRHNPPKTIELVSPRSKKRYTSHLGPPIFKSHREAIMMRLYGVCEFLTGNCVFLFCFVISEPAANEVAKDDPAFIAVHLPLCSHVLRFHVFFLFFLFVAIPFPDVSGASFRGHRLHAIPLCSRSRLRIIARVLSFPGNLARRDTTWKNF